MGQGYKTFFVDGPIFVEGPTSTHLDSFCFQCHACELFVSPLSLADWVS